MQYTKALQRLSVYLKSHWRMFTLLGGVSLLGVVAVCLLAFALIQPSSKFILSDATKSTIGKRGADVGLVLGAGVTPNGKPYKELQARLDVAADALQRGAVRKLILSGDNRFKNYDEPTAMRNYLIERRKIPANKLVLDYAGRSTYESCERTAKIFGQNKVVIFSAGSHLPRAIYLCSHFDVKAYGVSSGVEANNSTRREILARVKAIYNIYIRGEKTVLGASIKV